MTRLDDFPDELQDFFDRAQVELRHEVDKATKSVASLKAEKATLQTEVADLRDQCKRAKGELTGVLADLKRASGLVGLDQEIVGARKTLDALRSEIAQAEARVAKLAMECGEAEQQRDAVRSETDGLVQTAAAHRAEIAKIKALAKSFELAALKERVAELEAKAKPPAPFDPGPAQRFDYTAGMSIYLLPAQAFPDWAN
jgi:chromosome segregation ATPase